MRPVIGICSALERARWSVWDLDAALVPHNYIQAVTAAGGLALLVPPDPSVRDDPDGVLRALDGLLLVGGADVEAARYGAEPHPLAEAPQPLRDATEIALVRAAVARGLPTLGVCRGMQVLNVALGGTLIQHLGDDPRFEEHRQALGSFAGADHDVRLVPGSRAARAAGADLHRVTSHHHQGVGRVAEGLRVTGWAVPDELPEALEGPNGYLLGVQWHPEADPDSGLIASLVGAARR